jgi:16S rRNA (cytosine1402-N4)-methyltransferase
VFHIPVLLEEVLELLRLAERAVYVDGTLGGGGHAQGVARRFGAGVVVLGIDRDPQALDEAASILKNVSEHVVLRHGSYADVAAYLAEAGLDGADGVLVDLGVSAFQLATPERGFSHDRSGVLDCRFDPTRGVPAYEWIRRAPRSELVRALETWGELPRPEKAADLLREAVARERLTDTVAIARRIDAAVRVPGRAVRASTLVFQAIRIAVNGELAELERFLVEAPACLRPGGTLCCISYHSLEDRLVKVRFRELGRTDEFELLTKKPLEPTENEVRSNRKARSARLRAIRRRA